MPDFAVVTAFKATDRISPAFRRMSGEADRFGKHARASMGMASKSMSMLKGALPIFGVAALGMYINKAIELASSLTEVQNVVDTTFGPEGARQINAWSRTAIKNFGLSELQAKQFTGFLGAMMKSSGLAGNQIVRMSQDMAGLAGDFASFYNLPIEEAFDKIRAGISGETEPLKRIGINMSVANMQAFALSRGITKSWLSMTQAEQTLLRYNYLMKVSKDAQGDFNKTLATSYANQKRVAGVLIDQTLANLMRKTLPMLTAGLTAFNKALEKIDTDALANGIAAVVRIIPYVIYGFAAWKAATLAVAAAQIAMNLAGWLRYLWMMREFINAVTIKQWLWNTALLANPIGLITAAVAGLVLAIIALVHWGDELLAMFAKLTKFLDHPVIKGLLLSSGMGQVLVATNEKVKALKEKGHDFEAPNRAKEEGRGGIDFKGLINITGAPDGTTASGKTRGAPPINMNLVGAM